MRSRSNGGVIGAYALPNQNNANGVFFIHDAAIYNTGLNPIWPLSTAGGLIYSATGGTISIASDNENYKLHTFTANGTFTITTGAAFIDIFMVGGGGSGGSTKAAYSTSQIGCGGGGGGTVTIATGVWVNPGTVFTVEVGQGGTAALSSSAVSTLHGKTSKVSSSSGHSYTSPGGGCGAQFYYVGTSNFGYNGTNGGGGCAAYNGAGTNYQLNPASQIVGSGSPGTVTSTSHSGGESTDPATASYRAGGGAGASTNGYAGNYSFDPSKAGQGGDGYLWSRTNSYYGAGGAGGNANSTTATNGGLVGPSPGTGTYGQSARNTTQQPGYDGYGSGGAGSTIYNITSQLLGGNGGSGTVIFCYRYK